MVAVLLEEFMREAGGLLFRWVDIQGLTSKNNIIRSNLIIHARLNYRCPQADKVYNYSIIYD